METAVKEQSHVSPGSALRLGRKAHLSGLSQSVLLNRVGVLSPWEAQRRDWPAWHRARLWEGRCHKKNPRAEGTAGRPCLPGTSCEGRSSCCCSAALCPAPRAPWPSGPPPQWVRSGPFRSPMPSTYGLCWFYEQERL